MKGSILRGVAPFAAGTMLVGLVIACAPLTSTNQSNLPPVRAVFYVNLGGLWDVQRPTAESLYAQDLAAQWEARFLGSPNRYDWPKDLRVTAQAPPCFPPHKRCGSVSNWAFQVRSAEAIDPVAVGIALGPGVLTMRSIVSSNRPPCLHTALVYGGAPIAQPFIPEATAGSGCFQLGPVIRTLTRPSDVSAYSSYAPTRLVFSLNIDDTAWLATYSQTHLTPDIAVLSDEWVIGTVHPKVAVAHGITAPTTPFALETMEMKAPMAAAIITAVSSYEPWVMEPVKPS
jgi:hypothetical protein